MSSGVSTSTPCLQWSRWCRRRYDPSVSSPSSESPPMLPAVILLEITVAAFEKRPSKRSVECSAAKVMNSGDWSGCCGRIRAFLWSPEEILGTSPGFLGETAYTGLGGSPLDVIATTLGKRPACKVHGCISRKIGHNRSFWHHRTCRKPCYLFVEVSRRLYH